MNFKVSLCNPEMHCAVSFKSAQTFGKPVSKMLKDLDNIHLDDKTSIVLKSLEKDEFLMIAPKTEEQNSFLKRLMSLFGESIMGLYNIENSKFQEALTFFKENGIIKFVNLNYDPVKVNSREIKPFCGCDVKSGDRLWGSTLRSVLIKDEPDVSPDLARTYGLMAEKYDRSMVYEMAGEVFKRQPHTFRS